MAIDWDSIVADSSVGGGSGEPPAGGYVCTITNAYPTVTKGGKPAVVLVWDIAEGPFAGHFSADFYADKDFRHNTYLMLDAAGLARTKHKLDCIRESNSTPVQRFDAQWAVENSPQAFIGKRVGLVLQQRLTSKGGAEYSNLEVYAFATADDVRSGRVVEPPVRDERSRAAAPSVGDVAIPF